MNTASGEGFRIASARHSANDGSGARLTGGRWNHKGTAVIYCAATGSLCQLEILVHSAALPKDKVSIEAEIPDTVTIRTVANSELPPNWTDAIAPKETRDLGTDWVKSGATAVLSVPSAISPGERNYLLNPTHPDFKKIKFNRPISFKFDPRLR